MRIFLINHKINVHNTTSSRTKLIYISINRIEETPINNIISHEAIFFFKKISIELNYELILIHNQNRLGTEYFPRSLYTGYNPSILKRLKNEGIHLSSVYISIPNEFHNFVIKTFDKSQPIEKNYILIPKILYNFSWKRIYNFLKFHIKECSLIRRSKETDIKIFIKIDGKGISDIKTGFGFFDHMLDQICIHANIELGIKVQGDLYVDEHHSIEDTAIALGISLSKYIKDKRGITRYGFLLPMDDTLVQVTIDLGGRNTLFWKVNFEREKIGNVPTEMYKHFFKSFCDVTYCNLHIQAEGYNEHHKIEAIFKAFAYTLKRAIKRNINNKLPSSKEIL